MGTHQRTKRFLREKYTPEGSAPKGRERIMIGNYSFTRLLPVDIADVPEDAEGQRKVVMNGDGSMKRLVSASTTLAGPRIKYHPLNDTSTITDCRLSCITAISDDAAEAIRSQIKAGRDLRAVAR